MFNRQKNEKNESQDLSTLEECLLTLLAAESPSRQPRGMYGLEFTDAIAKASQEKRKISYGSLYPALHRMEERGLISFKWGDEAVGPRRKYYMITPKGREILRQIQEFRSNLIPCALEIYGVHCLANIESDLKSEIEIV